MLILLLLKLISFSALKLHHLIIISFTFVNIFEIFSRNLLISIYTEPLLRLAHNYIISIDRCASLLWQPYMYIFRGL